MSGKTQQQAPTAANQSSSSDQQSSEKSSSQQTPDNSVMQQKVAEKNKIQLFLDKYTNPEALTGYAEDAVSGLTKSSADLLKKNTDENPQVADQIAAALDVELKRVVRRLVMDTGVAQSISEQQTLLVLGALAAAATYVAKNSELPMLKTSFGLGEGHALDVGAGLGKTLDLALEKVQLKYRYSQSNLNMSIGGEYNFSQNGQPEKWSLNAGLNADLGAVDAYAKGNYRDDGSWDAAAGLRGGEDNWSWNVEGFSAKDQFGQQDSGVRAGLSWKF